jgi:hypothetical protein
MLKILLHNLKNGFIFSFLVFFLFAINLNAQSGTTSSQSSSSNSSISSATTTSSSSSTVKSVPKEYKAINSGRGTISCKLGFSTSSYAQVLDPTILLRLYERQLNAGWLVTYADSAAELEAYGLPIATMATLGQNVVINPCMTKDSCKLVNGEEYATYLWGLANSVKRPFWAYAGHHEMNVGGKYDEAEEAEFVKTLLATLNKLAYAAGVQDGTGYRIRGMINLISPELAFDSEEGEITKTPEAQLEFFRNQDIDFGEFKGLGFQAYTPEHMAKSVELAQKYKIQAYITAGIKLDTLEDEGAPLLSDKRALKFELEMINQYINNSNIAAIFAMNSLTIGENTSRVVPLDAYNLFNRVNRDIRFPYDGSSKKACAYLESQKLPCGDTTVGDRKEPISIDPNFPVFFESQALDLLDAAGCSNIFQYRCTNENVVRSKESGELLFSSSDKNKTDPIRRTFDQATIKTRDKIQANEVSGYLDFADMQPVFQDFRFERCSIPRSFSDCPAENRIIEEWKNVVVDVVFSTDVLTTAEVNFPLLRSLSSIDANGTSDLPFPTYPAHLGREGDDAGLSVDYARVADGDVYFDFPEGKKLPFPVPLLGNIYELYSLDKTVEKLTDPLYSKTKKYYVVDRNFYSFLFDSKTATSRIDALIKSISSNYGIDINYLLFANSFTSKALRSHVVDNNIADIGMKDYLKNGLTVFNQVKTKESNYPSSAAEKQVVEDSTLNKIQFDASEVTSGEGSLNVQTETELKLGKATLKEFANAPTNPLGGILTSNIKWSIEVLYNGADCENPNITAAEHTINGVPQIHSGELPAFQLDTLGAVIACYDVVKRIVSPDEKIIVAGDTSTIGSLAYVVLPAIDDNPNHQEFHGFKRAKFKGESVSGVPGAFNILRTAWSFSNRISQEFIDEVNSEDEGVQMNLCHPMDIDTKITTYNKYYAVTNKVSGTYIKPMLLEDAKKLSGGKDDAHLYCANVKNESRSGYRRPLVQLSSDGTQIAMATSNAPWMGTANAIFEDIAKRGYNLNTSKDLELPVDCQLPSNSQLQECLKVPRCGTNESRLSVSCLCKKDEPQYMGMEIYMCQAGMLEYSELVDYGLINPAFDPVKDPEKYNPQGCLFADMPTPIMSPTTTTPSGSPTPGNIASNCVDGITKMKELFVKVGQSICVPPEVIAGIWRQETNCSYPNVATLTEAVNTQVYPKSRGPGNNNLCTGCAKEILGSSYDYVNDDVTYIFQQMKACVAGNGGVNRADCNYAISNGVPENVQCCDVRGPFQFLHTTFYGKNGDTGYPKNPKMLECRASIGATGTVSRERFGDALCAAALLLKSTSGTGSKCSNWSISEINSAAGAYYGRCASSYCLNVGKYANEFKKYFQ